ncbi:MAG TPA: glycosyltransferase [Candidatus Methylomirabilis sp.]|nr:glycosyltransferase [Candidatus Methylomirabilis sp.]
MMAKIDQNLADLPAHERVKEFCEADVVLLYQPVGDAPIHNIRNLQTFIPSKRDGEWKYPPSIILESDDNLFNVSPLNQAFKSLGIRDMDGKLIPPGHHIGVVRNGERRVLWRDGESGFSLTKNRQLVESWKTLIRLADAVTVSTDGVKEAIEKEVVPRRVKVFPNLVRFDHYEQVELKDDPKKIKILWQGGIAHYEDWYPLREALGNITKKYPEVHWIIWGAQFPWVKELIPAHRLTFKDWCPYQEYKLRLVMMGHDIAVAPLQDNVFNRCRSAIKWYEASVLKKPVPTLAQNTGPYKNEIIDGETGLLFNDPEEFETQLSWLIEDAVLRKTLANNAKDWISENRDAFKKVPEVVSFWEQLREDRRTEQPHVSDEEWEEIQEDLKREQEAYEKETQELAAKEAEKQPA